MPTVFSKIIAGEIPAHIVAEDENFLAFLDVQPIVKGHVLVIPKIEVDYIFDLDDSTLSGLQLFAREVAKKIQRVVPCIKVGVAVVGLEVPHAHMHLIPLNSVGDLSFTKERVKMSSEELAALAEAIRLA